MAGSLAGVGLGLLMARGIATSIGQLISDAYGVAQRTEEVATNPILLGGALAVGILTSIVAAFVPARQAARVDPVQALQKGKYQVLTAGESRARAALAAGLGAMSIVCLLAGESRAVFYLGYLLAIIVALLLGPLLSQACGVHTPGPRDGGFALRRLLC